eukprot:2033447-Rhodomonas_salina.2
MTALCCYQADVAAYDAAWRGLLEKEVAPLSPYLTCSYHPPSPAHTTLSCYALPTRCPVLKQCIGYRAMRCPVLASVRCCRVQVYSAGTERAYGATRRSEMGWRECQGCLPYRPTRVLRDVRAVRAYAAMGLLRACYAMSGTERAYGAMAGDIGDAATQGGVAPPYPPTCMLRDV